MPRLTRIVKIDLDSQGTERYFVRGTGRFKTVRLAAQSLCLLLTAQEVNDNEDITRDSLEFLTKVPKNVTHAPSVKVTVDNTSRAIVDV